MEEVDIPNPNNQSLHPKKTDQHYYGKTKKATSLILMEPSVETYQVLVHMFMLYCNNLPSTDMFYNCMSMFLHFQRQQEVLDDDIDYYLDLVVDIVDNIHSHDLMDDYSHMA